MSWRMINCMKRPNRLVATATRTYRYDCQLLSGKQPINNQSLPTCDVTCHARRLRWLQWLHLTAFTFLSKDGWKTSQKKISIARVALVLRESTGQNVDISPRLMIHKTLSLKKIMPLELYTWTILHSKHFSFCKLNGKIRKEVKFFSNPQP
jgi:hypothetical protein